MNPRSLPTSPAGAGASSPVPPGSHSGTPGVRQDPAFRRSPEVRRAPASPQAPEPLVEEVRRRVLATGGPRRGTLSDAQLASEIRQVAAEQGVLLGVSDVLELASCLGTQLGGLGPLAPLLDDVALTDVLVNGGGAVFRDRGEGLEPVDLDLGGEAGVRALAVRLAARAGRRLDEASPWVDARLPGGVRLHAVLPPLSPDGTHLSLRVLRRSGRSLDDLVNAGTVPAPWYPVLRALVRRRAAFLVSGGTGAGKTTLLAALLSLVPATERLLLVEDVGEILPHHPHVVRLEARTPNVEGRGAVGLDDLVRQALRMRPDRLVVGECRGPEVRDLLAAMNTGHDGGCGTVHANAAGEVPARLEALGGLAGLSPDAVRVQVAAALDAVVHLRRDGPVRRVVEVAAVTRSRGDGVEVLPALLARPLPGRPEPRTRPRSGDRVDTRQGPDTRQRPDTRQGPDTRGYGTSGWGWSTGPGWGLLRERLGLPEELPENAEALLGNDHLRAEDDRC